MKESLFSEISDNAKKLLLTHIDKWKLNSFLELPSEWASENRFLPQGVSLRPGIINHSIAPHMVEIQDCAHPDSGIKQITIMKSTQSLATTTIENVMGWAIKNKLHNILYIISSKTMAKQRSSAAIDVLIDYSGLSDYVKPISIRNNQKKTGDNTYWKEFAGGYRLMLTSWNSIADAKSFHWDLIVMDELDEAGYELKGQGDPEALFTVRGVTSRNLRIFKLSTPTTTHGRIYKNFIEGDQRYYFCRCPLCGEFQILKTMTEGRNYGLTFQTEKKDNIEQVISNSVVYICQFCNQKIQEYKKQDLLLSGKWIPTARPVNLQYRSYHLSNLMSPIMFYSWTRVCQDWLETGRGQNITKLKSFVINILGEPWESRAEKKSWQELMSRVDDYEKGKIPQGGFILLGGADIQKNRIELQIVAYGAGMTSYVVDYQVFYGETASRASQVWNDLSLFLQSKKYKIKDIEIPITLTAIDTGYNPDEDRISGTNITTEHVVYEFVARNNIRAIACRGNHKLKDMIIKEERVKRQSPLKIRYDVAVNELKDEIFSKIDFPRGSIGEIHFPKNLGEEYFKGFVSEVFAEVEPGKWGYKKVFDRNEPLDTFILARAAAERLNLQLWTEHEWTDYERRILRIS